MLFNSNAEPFLPPADLEVCLGFFLLLLFFSFACCFGLGFFFVFVFGFGFVCSFCLFVVVIVSGWLGI